MRKRIRPLIYTSFLFIMIGAIFLAGKPEPSSAQDDGFELYYLYVHCGSKELPAASFTHRVTEGGTVGRPVAGTKVICAGNCAFGTFSLEDELGKLPAAVSAAFKAKLQEHEVKAAAGKAHSLAGCGSKCDSEKYYNDYLRKRQVAMELFKHASDLRLTATNLVAERWGAEADNLRWEGEKEVAGDMAWDDFGRHVQRGMRGSRTALSQSWLARRGVSFAIKGWNAIGWIAEAALTTRRGIATAADYADYQKEAQEATKQAEEMWRKALADFEAYLTQKCSSSDVIPKQDRERLERAKAAIEEWDNNQNLYWDPIRNEAVTFSEAIRRSNEYLKSGKISHLLSNPKFVMAAFAESDDPPDKKALRAAISELDKAIPSWDRLSGSISKYLKSQRSIELKLESAFGVSGTGPVTLSSISETPAATTSGVKAQQAGTASHLQPEHREAVQQWLMGKPNLRLALDGDYVYKSDLAADRAGFPDYHPYYLVADFNGDKKDDFAIVLVNTQKRAAKFSIAVFNGPIREDSKAAFFREGFDFRRMAFTAAQGLIDERRTTLFVQNPHTGKGWMLSLGRKGYFLEPSQEDFI